MKENGWERLSGKLFSLAEAAAALNLAPASAKVACNRKVKSGYLIRVKRDLYARREWWENPRREELFIAANRIQVPSYISLSTALAFYERTTQAPQDYIESVSVIRSVHYAAGGREFSYHKLNKILYSGFKRLGGFFIASPEKALLDAIHLTACGRYALDASAVEWEKFSRKEVYKLSKNFPIRTKRLLERLWPR